MKLLVVLLFLVPFALAGDFEAAFKELEKELESNGWDHKQEPAGWGWGGEKKDEEKKDEEKKDEEKKDEDAGWKDILKKMGEKMQEDKDWGWKEEKPDAGWGWLGKIQDMLAAKEAKKKEMEEKKAFLEEKLKAFYEYSKMKKEKKEQDREEKVALYNQLKNIKEKKNKVDELKDYTESLKKDEMMLQYKILKKIAYFCPCEENMGVFERLMDGSFGKAPKEEEEEEEDPQGAQPAPANSDTGAPTARGDIASMLAAMEQEALSQYVLDDVYSVMCDSAGQYLEHLVMVEKVLIEADKAANAAPQH